MKSLKKLCYICGNIGVVGWIVIFVLEGMSAIKGLIALAIAVPLLNSIIWYVFKRREKDALTNLSRETTQQEK